MPPGLSLVISTYNRASLLGDTLKALRSQRCPEGLQWEVIVVDNNSRDETRRVVEHFADSTSVPVRYVFEPRQGLSHARNRGLLEAKGAIIAFTDDDVLPAPGWIAGIPAALARWESDGIGGRILPRWEAAPPPWLLENPDLLSRLALMDSENSRLLIFPRDGSPQVWGANMAFRREVFDQVGGFDPKRGMRGDKFFRGEEVELIERALGAGLRIAYDATLTVFHRIGPDRMRKAYFRKLFFDLGQGEAIAASTGGTRVFLGAPLWLYRRAAFDFGAFLITSLLRRPSAFRRQLDCLSLAGRIVGHWNTLWNQGAH